MTSKLQQIKSYLATGRSLTPAEAIINGFGFRLAARVLDLRRQGVPVVTEIRENPATGDKYAAYRLPKVGDRVAYEGPSLTELFGERGYILVEGPKMYLLDLDCGRTIWCNKTSVRVLPS